jgi:crotonobetainyl-CoA:carnitine CoA-transferase CaiB-like acyl-CoA transferase
MNTPFAPGILDGVRILDFSHQLSGPYGTAILADMGADVLKIESPGRGDGLRYDGTFDGKIGTPHIWAGNRNKRSVTLNIRKPEGRELALELARRCDAVVENFRPGVMEGRGLGYADIRAVRPDVVYLSVSAFGHEGPLRDRPGQNIAIEAMSGMLATTGESEDRPPVKSAAPIVDTATGVYGALALTLALYHRQRTGAGQHIRLSMLDCALSLQNNLISALLLGRGSEKRLGSAQPNLSPYQAFRAADGHYFIIGCMTNAHWRGICSATGLPELTADPRFADMKSRVANRAELNAILEPRLATRTADDWVETLSAADVPSVRVYKPSEALQLEQVRVNAMVQEMDHPVVGRHKALASPLRMDPPPTLRRHSPMLGEHTDEVLTWLGKSEDDLRTLREGGVI